MIEPENKKCSCKTDPTETWFLRGIETLCRRQKRNLLAVTVFLLAVCLPFELCFAASPSGESKKVASAPAPLTPGAYFGLKLPGVTPELFAPGIISTPGRNVDSVAFSPDATECYFTVFDADGSNNRILFTRYENGAWTPQAPVTFTDGRAQGAGRFSNDGNRFYFAVNDSTSPPVWPWTSTIKMVRRDSREAAWGKPESVPELVGVQSADGTMYFSAVRDGGLGVLDIYRTVSKPGQPLQVENLGAPVNTKDDDGGPGISPDGHTLVFYSAPWRAGVKGGAKLFICFDNGHGGWTTPVNMGEGFNSPGDEYGATFSLDGRVLFFTRVDEKKHGDIYWVSTTALERFRQLSH
jgi:Tol biopolymer transport system component